MCLSTGGSGLAAIDSDGKAARLATHIISVSSKLDTSDFWIGGAYFGPDGSNTLLSNWFWFPSWNSTFSTRTTSTEAVAKVENPWLWRNPFPSMKAEYYTSTAATDNYTSAAATDGPNSCMIVRYDRVLLQRAQPNTWWEQRACGWSGVSAFVRPPTPFPRLLNTFIPYRMIFATRALRFYHNDCSLWLKWMLTVALVWGNSCIGSMLFVQANYLVFKFKVGVFWIPTPVNTIFTQYKYTSFAAS